MSKSSNLIVVSNANNVVPREFLEKAIASYPTWSGLVFVDNGELTYDAQPGAAKIEEIMSLNESSKAVPMAFIFGKDDKLKTENMQPFTLLTNAKDEAILMAVLDGVFSEYTDEKQPDLSGAYLFTQQFLIPKIKSLARLTKGELQPIVDELKEMKLDNEWLSVAVADEKEPCLMTLISATKDFMTAYVGDDSKVGEFPWGWTSNDLGMSDKTTEVVNDKPAPAKELTVQERLALKKAGGKPPENTAKPPVIAAQTAPPPVKTDTATVVDIVMGKPFEILKSNNELRQWYVKYTGKKNEKFKERPEAIILPAMVAEFINKGGKPTRTIAKTETVSQTPPPSGNANKPTLTGPAVPLPVLNADQKANVSKYIKTLDLNGRKIISPDEMAKAEKTYASFIQSAGLDDLEDVSKFTWQAIWELVKDHPVAAAMLIRDFQYQQIRMSDSLEGTPAAKTA